MKRFLSFVHILLLTAAVGYLGVAIFSPYFYSSGSPCGSCLAVRKSEDRTVLVLKASPLRNHFKSTPVNLLSFYYGDTIPTFRAVEKARVQRYIDSGSLFSVPCSFEDLKKRFTEYQVPFWQPVESVWVGIQDRKQIRWIPLHEYARPLPSDTGRRLEQFVFLYPETLESLENSTGVIRFFNGYFIDAPRLTLTKAFPSGVKYVKIVLKAPEK